MINNMKPNPAKIISFFAAWLLASAIVSRAAISVVSSGTAQVPNTTTASLTIPGFNMGAGNALVVMVSGEGQGGLTPTNTITFNGIPLTGTLGSVITNSGVQGSAIYWAINPTTTSGDVVVTFNQNYVAGVTVLSLGGVAGVNTSSSATGITTGTLNLPYAGTVGGMVVMAGVDNRSGSGVGPTFGGTPLGGTNFTAYTLRLAANFAAGSSGLCEGYGSIAATSSTLTNTWTPGTGGSTSTRNAATLVSFDALVFSSVSWRVGDGNWDINTTPNWTNGAAAVVYQELAGVGSPVTFDDSASGNSPIIITLNTNVSPSALTNNSSKSYTITGTGSIGGGGALAKAGNGTLTLGTANTYSGGSILNGGTTLFSALNNLGTGNITFGGGTLKYNGNSDDISVVKVTFNAGGATIDTAGQSPTYANPIGTNSVGGLTKTGAGTLTLNLNNRYSGNTVISNGTLALGGSTTFISNSAAIIVNGGATLDATIPGLTFKGGVAQILAGNGAISGSVVSSNGVITPGTNGVVGTLTFNNDLTLSGGSLKIDLATNAAQRDLISVGGNLSLNGGTLQLNVTGALTNGVYKLIQYTGSLSSGGGSSANLLLTGYSQAGKILALSDSIPNEIDLVVSSAGGANIVWQGDGGNNYWDVETSANFTNSSGSPVQFVQADNPTFNDTSANPTVSLNANLQPGSVTVTATANNYVLQDGTGIGAGKLSGTAGITKNGSTTLTIATANVNSGPTVINGGTVQVGNGGTLGDLGSGNVTNNGALVFAQSDNHTVSGSVSGSGSVTQQGGGVVTLVADNTYSGPTTISSGTLQIGNGGSTGLLGANSVTDNGTLAFNRTGSLTIPNTISGAGSLAFSGGGIFTLTGANSYSGGGVTVNTGSKLIIGNASAIPAGSSLIVQASGTNDLNGFNLNVTGLNSTAGSGGRIVNNSGTATNVLTIDNASAADGSIVIADNDGIGGKIALVKTGAGQQILRGASTYTGGTVVSNGTLQLRSSTALGSGLILLRGGNISLSGAVNLANAFQADTDAAIVAASSANLTFSGLFTSVSNLTFSMVANETWSMGGGATQLDGVTGTIIVPAPATTSFFRFTSSLGSVNATFDLTGSSVQLATSGTGTYQLGALIGDTAASALRGVNGVVWAVGAKNLDTTFAGALGTSGGLANSLTKVGTGRLTLSGPNNFSSTVTVSNGVLALIEPTSCDSNSAVVLGSSTAILDVSGRTDGTLNLGNSIAQTLRGIGTIDGSLNEAVGSTVNVGLGTLTVTNVATLNGALIMQLNRTNATTASKLIAGLLVNAAALTVTNVGPALQGGDTFSLFNGAVTGFTVTNLPALTGSMYWTNNLAVNGSLTVINPINPNPPQVQVSVSGSTLSLAWPTNAGWILQSNSVGLASSAAWFNYPANGSVDVTNVNITMDPAKTNVFFRMLKP
jgi:fibronectin-binding autotransporter adhesin